MNKIYRLVWNARKACWMAASELARSSCSRGAVVRAGAAVSLLSLGLVAEAGPPTATPVGGNTRSYVAPNGTTVVDIATPNGAGVSSNQYTDYNVNAQGLILNNANVSQITRQSQLAGQIYSNTNLSAEARLILNQVVGANRSTLNGFTEVLGQKADVVVANPYGITCGGCGFINSDRVTLTTGVPVFGSDGSLSGLSVTQGDILINGTGINASAQQILDLVSRSVVINGQVNANDLGIYAGASQWSYATRAVTGSNTPADSAPAYAIDTSALGGMYANRIFLISTEAGVGVRMLGNAAANTGEFSLSAAGDILINSKISAATSLSVASSSNGAAALQLNDASLSAGQDLTLASQGGTGLAGSAIVAGRDLSVSAASLIDAASTNTQTDNNKRFGGRNLTAAILGTATVNGTEWGAGSGNLAASYGSLGIGAQGGLFYATTNLSLASSVADLALGIAQIKSGADLALTARGAISTLAASTQGILATAGNLSIKAGNGLSNAGVISAQAGSASYRIDGALLNSGQMYAKTTLDIADASGAGSQSVTNLSNAQNNAQIIADGALTLRGAALENQSGARVQAGASTINGASLNNAGDWLLSTADGAPADAVTLSGALSNSGTLQSARSLVLNAQSLSNSNKLLAANSLTASTSAAFNTLANSYTQAGQGITVSAASLDNQGNFKAPTLALTTSGVAGLNNSGVLQADTGSATLRVAGVLSNSGKVYAGGTLDIADASGGASEDIHNTGSGNLLTDATLLVKGHDLSTAAASRIQAAAGSNLDLASADNAGTILLSTAGGATDTVNLSGALGNSGVLQSARALNLLAASAANSGRILASGNLGATFSGLLDNSAGSYLQSAAGLSVSSGSITNAGTMKAQTVGLTATSGLTNSAIVQADLNSATLRSGGTLNNSGTVYGATLLDLADATGNASEAINNSGYLLSGGTLSLKGAAFSNTSAGWTQAGSGSNVTVASLNNAGTMLLSTATGATADTLTVSGALTDAGTLQSARALNLAAASANISGKLLASADLGLTLAGALTNQSGAVIQSGQTLSATGVTTLTNSSTGQILANGLVLSAADLNNSGIIQGGASSASSITLANTLTNNSGAVLNVAAVAGGAGTLTANAINNAGTLQSAGDLTLAVGAGNLTDSGQLLAGGTLTSAGRNGASYAVTVNGSGVLQGDTLNLTANSLTLNGTSVVQSQGDMNLTLGSLGFGASLAHLYAASSTSGTGTINLSSALSNNAGIFSGNDLVVNAPGITITSTGGFAALHDLTLNSGAGNLTNSGSLYAANNLSATAASGTLTNVGDANGAVGTINAGGNIALTAQTIVNNSQIRGDHDITLTAATIRNEAPGGDTRYWGGGENLAQSEVSHTSQGYNGCCCVDQNETWYYQKTWSERQYYSVNYPLVNGVVTLPKPQILGGGTITLQQFNLVSNLAGVISAPTVSLSGNSGSTFTNDDLSLQQKNYKETWEHYIKYIAAGPATYTDDSNHNNSGPVQQSVTTVYNPGAGIFANSLNGNNFALVNNGSPFAAGVSTSGVSGASVTPAGATGAANGTGGSSYSAVSGSGGAGASSYAGVGATSGANVISFGGIHIALPTNPNGYFVQATKSNSLYLVETNPVLGNVRAGFSGSNYMLTQLGFDPATAERRLGDANYEAYLIAQQIIAQTGSNVLKGYQNQAAELDSLMNSGIAQGKAMGLTVGQAPTQQQLANLTQDMVWMVSTVVNGQTVLAPQVFLSAATRAGIESGAVLSASNTSLNVSSLTNTGGTIAGSQALTITSQGNITNTSGLITGGDVSLTSSSGNIVNQTLVSGSGSSELYATSVGKVAGISATNNLALNAAGDISNLGASMAAGGNASLSAGGNVTFDTLENKNASTTHTSQSGFLASGTTDTTTTTVQQLKSGLSTGGNLSVSAGKDITFAGTDVNAAGDASLNAAGNVNLLARANSTTVHSESTFSGLGVGGGLAGTTSTVADSNSSRNVGSTLNVGGNASVTAGKDLTLQGSQLQVKGDATLNATNVNVLAGLDSDTSHVVTTTSTFLATSSGGSAGAQASAGASSSSGGGQAAADAGAQAGAQAQGNAGLVLASTTQTTTDKLDTRHVASQIGVGGNLTVNAGNDVTLKGSTVTAGGDATINARNVNVLAVADVSTTNTNSTTTSIGLMASSDNQASAGARASASADSGGAGKAGADTSKLNAQASASAEASASSNNDLTLASTTTRNDNSLDITHQGSAISSGGNLNINAANKLTTQGSSLAAGADLNLAAGDMSFQAVQDVHQVSSTSNTTSVGLYANASADAKANADAGASGANMSASANASASASAEAGVGVKVNNTQSSSLDGSTTAVTSSLSAGGNLNRNARGNITDVGTQIAAGGDLNQSASTITSLAAANTTYSNSSTTSNTAQVGLYASASAEASASASGNAGVGAGGLGASPSASADASASAGVGVEAKYSYQQDTASSNSSNAVASNIKVGGNVNSKSSGATTLVGTNIESGGDTNLAAGSLNYQAAQNTSSNTSSSTSGAGKVQVAIDVSGSGASASYDASKSSDSSTTAVVGGINAGGKLNIKTSGDAVFEGSNLASAGSTTLTSGGNVVFNAARDTSTSSGNNVNASLDVSIGKSSEGSSGSFAAAGGYSQNNASSSNAVTGSINSGGGLSINAGKDATFVGTSIASAGDASVAAGGNLKFDAARSTSSSESFGVSASLGGGKEKSSEKGTDTSKTSGDFSLGGNYSQAKSDTASAGAITSGGNLKLSSGGDTTLVGTGVAASGQTSVAAGGNVNVLAAVSTASNVGFSAAIGGSTETEKTRPSAGSTGAAAGAGSAASAAGGAAKAGAGSATEGAGAGKAPTSTTTNEFKSSDNSLSLQGGTSSTSQVASLGGGSGLSITSGGNTSFAGTTLASGGDVAVQAGGNVTFGTANSSNLSGGIGASAGNGGAMINQAQIAGGESKQVSTIQNAGNLSVVSGGTANLQGTKGQSDGTVAVQAAGGVKKEAVVSGGAEVGLTNVSANLQVQNVSLQGAGRTLVQTDGNRSFSAAVAIPPGLPAGSKVLATTTEGKPLPAWLNFDAASGKFSGTPPADFSGTVRVNVSVPQSDGSVRQVPLTFSAP